MDAAKALAESSEYLCKELVWDAVLDITIDRVEMKGIPKPGSSKKDRCPVIFFEGRTKGHVLSRGRFKFLIRHYGGETDAWKGKPVLLYVSCKDTNNHLDNSYGRIDFAIGSDFVYEKPPRRPNPGGKRRQQQQRNATPPPASAPEPAPPEPSPTDELVDEATGAVFSRRLVEAFQAAGGLSIGAALEQLGQGFELDPQTGEIIPPAGG